MPWTHLRPLSRRAALAGVTVLAACAGPPVTTVNDLPGWHDDDPGEALGLASDAARPILAGRRPVALPRLLFTGYFEITLPGARAPSAAFPTPVLRRPPGTLATRFDRAAILAGGLAGGGLELAWLRSAADLFFLQLQGAGRIVFAGGDAIRVGLAGSNDRPPVPTETLFATAGLPRRDLSIPALRRWVAAFPDRGEAILMRDPSYGFFRATPAGPRGASGLPLRPLRTLAVDPAVVPLGSLLWIDVAEWRRLVVAADTGPDIRSARADLFFGAGPEAELRGGSLHERGRAWLLLP